MPRTASAAVGRQAQLHNASPPPAPAAQAAERSDAARPRLLGVDAARGAAMLFVCLSHFAGVYFPSGGAAETILSRVSMIATPTFMLLSGIVLAALAHDAARFGRHRDKLIDRGLFQLTIGHVLVCAATVRFPVVIPGALARGEVTDVVGLALIVGALLAPRTAPAARVGLGVALVVVHAAVGAVWTPATVAGDAVYAVLFGTRANARFDNAFPVFPWLGVYFVGLGLGGALARDLATDVPRAARRLARWGGGAALVALAAKGTYHILKTVGGMGPNEAVFTQTYLFGRYPPSPGYLLLYVGIGCVAVAAMLLADARGASRAVLKRFAVVGRASWAVFVTQFAVYNVLAALIRPGQLGLAAAPIVFAATLVPPVLVGWWWASRDLNRYLTVGYPWRWRPARRGRTATRVSSDRGSWLSEP
jgi:uncharacterized membrane protein